MSGINRQLGNLTVGEALVGGILGWILVELWQRTYDDIIYDGLGLPRTWFVTLLLALLMTALFLGLVFIVIGSNFLGPNSVGPLGGGPGGELV